MAKRHFRAAVIGDEGAADIGGIAPPPRDGFDERAGDALHRLHRRGADAQRHQPPHDLLGFGDERVRVAAPGLGQPQPRFRLCGFLRQRRFDSRGPPGESGQSGGVQPLRRQHAREPAQAGPREARIVVGGIAGVSNPARVANRD
jgi:hypothetical protein